MKILITGGMGYVGSHLIDLLLKDKHKIILLTKSYSKKKNISHIKNKIKIEKIDVTNQRKLSKRIDSKPLYHRLIFTNYERPCLAVGSRAHTGRVLHHAGEAAGRNVTTAAGREVAA